MSSAKVLFGFALVAILRYKGISAEVRWCPNGDISEGYYPTYSNATQYNDELFACMQCLYEARLVFKLELRSYQCCNGRIAAIGICPGKDIRETCTPLSECDGVKQCYDGSDEMGCNECSEDSFTCEEHTDGPKCIAKSQVCDSVKDCEGGKDETLCPYYGGWCSGYTCGGKHPKCIDSAQVCDGTKDCIDGSDETNCQYCLNQFRCRVYFRQDIYATSAECVGRFRVCDGIQDCLNGADEVNCYRWMEWSSWSGCGEMTESCTRIRSRLCVSSEGVVVPSTWCYAEDYLNDVNENHVDICPECLTPDDNSTTVPSSTISTQTSNDSTTHRYISSPRPASTSKAKPIHQNTTLPGSTTGGTFLLPLKMGGILGIAVGAGLFLLAVLISILIYCVKRKQKTGTWRPPIKLPRPSRSNLPRMTTRGVKKVKKVRPGSQTHPYPLKQEELPGVPKNKQQTSMWSTSGAGMDSGIEEGHSNSSHDAESPREVHRDVV